MIMDSGACQGMTPLDSLFSEGELHIGEHIAYKPIQLWQRISYQTPALNCQFEPSCSNYMVEAMEAHGLVAGLAIGTDRIVRCNPAARHYHMNRSEPRILADGRLLDKVDTVAETQPGKNPFVAMGLSVIPGLGRAYAGQPVDGFYSFIFVAGFAVNSASHYNATNTGRAGVMGALAGLFWIADIYGAYRTASISTPDP